MRMMIVLVLAVSLAFPLAAALSGAAYQDTTKGWISCNGDSNCGGVYVWGKKCLGTTSKACGCKANADCSGSGTGPTSAPPHGSPSGQVAEHIHMRVDSASHMFHLGGTICFAFKGGLTYTSCHD